MPYVWNRPAFLSIVTMHALISVWLLGNRWSKAMIVFLVLYGTTPVVKKCLHSLPRNPSSPSPLAPYNVLNPQDHPNNTTKKKKKKALVFSFFLFCTNNFQDDRTIILRSVQFQYLPRLVDCNMKLRVSAAVCNYHKIYLFYRYSLPTEWKIQSSLSVNIFLNR